MFERIGVPHSIRWFKHHFPDQHELLRAVVNSISPNLKYWGWIIPLHVLKCFSFSCNAPMTIPSAALSQAAAPLVENVFLGRC
jgi:hypothetical protein